MTYQSENQKITFVLPLYFAKAEITFTRQTGNENITIPVTAGEGPRVSVSTRKFEKGFWLAQLNWSVGRSRYCSEGWFEIA